MTTELSLLSALLVGLAGSVHCVGMCGGVVGAFSLMLPRQQAHWPYLLAYNTGRISSYTLAGALTGWLSSLIRLQVEQSLFYLQLLSATFILLLALYIGQWWQALAYLERGGRLLWRFIQPLTRHFVPLRSPLTALPYGMLWGWLPCGLVYSTLSWSLASGSTGQGALLMLCFGLGTLPAMLLLGSSAQSIKQQLASPVSRKVIASLLLLMSLWMFWQLSY